MPTSPISEEEQKESILGFLEPKRIATLLQPVSVYSRRVLKLKRAAFVAAMILAVAILIWPRLITRERSLYVSFTPVKTDLASSPQMENPRIHGIDDKGRSYTVTAKLGLQETKDTIVLKEVNGDILTGSSMWFSVMADQGTVHIPSKTISLKGNVQLYSSMGYEAHTKEVTILLDQGITQGNTPIRLQGPLGTLTANQFEIKANQNRIQFKKQVKVVLYTR